MWLPLGLAGVGGKEVLVAGEGCLLGAPRLDRCGDVRPGGDTLPVLDYPVDGSQRHLLLVFGYCPVLWPQDALLPGQVRGIRHLPTSGVPACLSPCPQAWLLPTAVRCTLLTIVPKLG